MKYLKEFELYKDNPQIGDYIIAEFVDPTTKAAKELETKIGQIVEIERFFYKTKYDYTYKLHPLKREQIKYFSKNKEDLEEILNAKKYNL